MDEKTILEALQAATMDQLLDEVMNRCDAGVVHLLRKSQEKPAATENETLHVIHGSHCAVLGLAVELTDALRLLGMRLDEERR